MATWHDFSDVLKSLQFDDAPAGGSLVIFKDNQVVVNTSVGQALPNVVWDEHTLSVNFSIGKGVMATLIAALVSKGLLSYDKPIAHVWGQFAVNGKQDITLRHILTHTANLFNIADVTNDPQVLLNWQLMGEKIANMTPSAPKPKDNHHYASAYSALVSGWILGHVVEKVTQLTLQAALDTFLAEPLGIKGELYFGVPSDKLDQVAKPVYYFDKNADTAVRRKPTLKPDTKAISDVLNHLPISYLWQDALGDTPLSTASINKLYFDTSKMNLMNYKNALMPNGRDGVSYHSQEVMQACIPAANGVSTANALATIYAMHANGGVWQNQTIISAKVLDDLRRVQVDGLDAVMPANMKWRTGFHRLFSIHNVPNAYGHMGYNGSVAFCDPDSKLAFAFIHNFDTVMLNDVRQFALSEMAIALA
ncbi:beta-lactamase family protein [Moraxella nasovis]|uniref:serine hydrolase domain-containing protein n=1 Tax=Moraxella nasovis TaxID=2904121 RepID=UPI001F618820|nr:serine hydrolase domain-containing protein [Moraxella nasovis]UNU73091.1 beta-lactamase family protein [Moraxella nasovis]